MTHKHPLLPAFGFVTLMLGAAAAMAQAPSIQQRTAAAKATAESASNACLEARPFYWEIGDRTARSASGSLSRDGTTVTARTMMPIASASKWIYSSYVAELAGGKLSSLDRQFLSFRSGFTNMMTCESSQTVDGCLAFNDNGEYNARNDGVFYYNGGHMQKHASMAGLGAMNIRALGLEVRRVLGTDLPIAYVQPRLDGGVAMSADGYGRFLRKILSGSLKMSGVLGTGKVCSNPLTCGFSQARVTPVPMNESWSYSVGHWVEDDRITGDGSFSSAGALGFYPWIDAGKKWYGIVSRVSSEGPMPSVTCGQLIRKAWIRGVAQ